MRVHSAGDRSHRAQMSVMRMNAMQLVVSESDELPPRREVWVCIVAWCDRVDVL
jgi:hypothetical protein